MLQKQVDWFESWFGSPYYKILYKHRDVEEARDFVSHLVGYFKPLPLSKILDIACGEGRFSLEFAKKGFDVTGIDLSNESIAIAKKQEKENLQFFVHDMRFPFYINYFDFAFNFFTSFGYFENKRDNQMATNAFAKSIKHGGVLVIDYLNREKSLHDLVPNEVVERGDYKFYINRKLEDNHFIKKISVTDERGGQHVFKESVAAFTLTDFIGMFKKAGLSLFNTFGDYQLNDYNHISSPRMIMAFKK